MSLPPEPLLKTFGARQLTPNGGAHPLMTTMSVNCARPFDRNTNGNSLSHRSFPTPLHGMALGRREREQHAQEGHADPRRDGVSDAAGISDLILSIPRESHKH